MGKWQTHSYTPQTRAKRSALSQQAQINRRAQRQNKHKTEKTEKIHKRSTALERSENILLGWGGGLNWFHGANLTLNSDVDQDT